MKRGGVTHPKTVKLAALLKCQTWGAVGLLETLFHYVAAYAPQGDIGRLDDLVIAKGLGWEGKPNELIDMLVLTGWLDKNENSDKSRSLIVRNWSRHCDWTTHAAVARLQPDDPLLFADGTRPNLINLHSQERENITAAYNKKYGPVKGLTPSTKKPSQQDPGAAKIRRGGATNRPGAAKIHRGGATNRHGSYAYSSSSEEREGENSVGVVEGPAEEFDFTNEQLDVLRGLKATGKFESLTVEHVVMVMREYPKARLTQQWQEIAAEAKGVAGQINSAMPWLRKAVSALESRNVKKEGAGNVDVAPESRPTFRPIEMEDE